MLSEKETAHAEGNPRRPQNKIPDEQEHDRSTEGPRQGFCIDDLDLQKDEKGRVYANLANAALVLRSAPQTARAFAFDQMGRVALVVAALPGRDGQPDPTFSGQRPLTDTDVSRIQEWLQVVGLPRLGKGTVFDAVGVIAAEHAFHPVQDYFASLRWDGTPRLDTWLATYCRAEANPYTSGIGRMFLLSVVARVHQPGCKADYMMVLEGAQGMRKSTACQILGGSWFTNSLPDLRAKDSMQHMRGKLLIEVAELAGMRRADAETLKAFITREVERYRPPHGRTEVIEPRQCIFIGTTNKSVYLKDETGARRFWPVKVGLIDTDALKRDRDQLYAEAVHRYRAGDKWWPNAEFERRHIRTEQQSRFESDPWEELISEWLAAAERRAAQELTVRDDDVSVGRIASEVLKLEPARMGAAARNRVTAVLDHLGWERQPVNWKGITTWKKRSGGHFR